jgi:hypothetical protein
MAAPNESALICQLVLSHKNSAELVCKRLAAAPVVKKVLSIVCVNIAAAATFIFVSVEVII